MHIQSEANMMASIKIIGNLSQMAFAASRLSQAAAAQVQVTAKISSNGQFTTLRKDATVLPES
jgi:hypothetical protein